MTFHPDAWTGVREYARVRGIPKSTALSELILYILKGDRCETNPKIIEHALSALRDSDGSRGLA